LPCSSCPPLDSGQSNLPAAANSWCEDELASGEERIHERGSAHSG
jgi:hypothetical protein